MKADLSSSKVVKRIGNISNGDAFAWWSWNAVLVEYQQMPLSSALPGLLPSQFLIFGICVCVHAHVCGCVCVCICIGIGV